MFLLLVVDISILKQSSPLLLRRAFPASIFIPKRKRTSHFLTNINGRLTHTLNIQFPPLGLSFSKHTLLSQSSLIHRRHRRIRENDSLICVVKMKGQSMIIKLIKWKRFGGRRANKTISSSSKNNSDKGSSAPVNKLTEMGSGEVGDIKWEVRPGGMLVQKRDHIISSSSSSSSSNSRESTTTSTIRISIIHVSTASHWHDVSIDPTSTFGELKVILSLMTGLEPREQRLLYRGREREDDDHLYMVGVSVGDKVLLLEDPALKDTRTQLLLTRRSSLNVDNRLSPPHESHFRPYGRSSTISVCSSNKEDKENLRPMG